MGFTHSIRSHCRRLSRAVLTGVGVGVHQSPPLLVRRQRQQRAYCTVAVDGPGWTPIGLDCDTATSSAHPGERGLIAVTCPCNRSLYINAAGSKYLKSIRHELVTWVLEKCARVARKNRSVLQTADAAFCTADEALGGGRTGRAYRVAWWPGAAFRRVRATRTDLYHGRTNKDVSPALQLGRYSFFGGPRVDLILLHAPVGI